MLIVTSYVCEICGNNYTTAEEAEACEAQGYPEPMPFLPLDKEIPAFGEGGVLRATIVSVGIDGRDDGKHRWVVETKPWAGLSHNLSFDDPIPATAFDPRYGFDAFRYGATDAEIRCWRETLAAYGFTEDDASDWIRSRIQKASASTR